MYNLEVLEDRLIELLVKQSDSIDLYVGPRENLTHDHILVDGHVNMTVLTSDIQKLFEEMSKPQIVNDEFEADKLPEGVLMLTEQGGYWESLHFAGDVYWTEPGGNNSVLSEDLTYPATVIHRSEAWKP